MVNAVLPKGLGTLALAPGRPPELQEKDGGVDDARGPLSRCELRIVEPHAGRDCQLPDRKSAVAVIRAMLAVAWTIPTIA